VRPKSELLRFVVAPDSTVIVDLAQNLPGRGLWVSADRVSIETASKKNVFSRAAKETVTVDPLLADVVATRVRQRCLDFIGFSRSAGTAVLGAPQVEAAIKSRALQLILIADDAAQNGIDKIGKVSFPIGRGFTRDELGAALGHENVVYAGFKGHGLTEKLKLEISMLEKISGKTHLYTDKG
jgi:predicted RNA-binding protein YlxR (DUF448 family)